jgi:hypothetical protein
MAKGVLTLDMRWQYDDSTLEISNDKSTTGQYGKVTFTITDVYDTVSSVRQS